MARHPIEAILRQFDNEERELVLRLRLWKSRWFPYRTAEYLGYDEQAHEMQLGPWRWHRPDVLRQKRTQKG